MTPTKRYGLFPSKQKVMGVFQEIQEVERGERSMLALPGLTLPLLGATLREAARRAVVKLLQMQEA